MTSKFKNPGVQVTPGAGTSEEEPALDVEALLLQDRWEPQLPVNFVGQIGDWRSLTGQPELYQR